jgi:bifunctional non-homologous end joining protein LigD
MKALRVPELPAGNWLYEMKFDGYRALAFKAGREVRLVSRNNKDFGDDYPLLLDALKSLRAKNFLIDGEIAALDSEGRSSFQLLQSYGIRKNIPLVCYAFDLLSLEGTDVRDEPLLGRRRLLAQLLKNAPANIRFSEELQGTKEALLEIAHKFGLEGLVAKRLDSSYEPGRRSGAWVKVKITQQQEFVVGGYTPPEGSRMYFGSLLVGYYGPDGLLFAGRVGTGFSERVLAALYDGMQKIKRAACPFVNLPEKRRGRFGQGITPAMMKRCVWVEPVLVAQIKFTEWTLDDQLRQPVFLGLRSDKDRKRSFGNREPIGRVASCQTVAFTNTLNRVTSSGHDLVPHPARLVSALPVCRRPRSIGGPSGCPVHEIDGDMGKREVAAKSARRRHPSHPGQNRT